MKSSDQNWRRGSKRWILFIAIPGIALLLALGAWQTYRLFWKIELNDFRSQQIMSEPVALPEKLEPFSDWYYRPVFVLGSFQHDQEMYLAARSFKSNVGYQILTPFKTLDGRIVIINRGWVPEAKKEASTRVKGQVKGTIRINGLVVKGQEDGFMRPENVPEEKFWYWIDLPEISRFLDIQEQNFLIDADNAENYGGLPVGGQTRVILRNEHLQYAIVWYSLAIALGVITYIIRRRSKS